MRSLGSAFSLLDAGMKLLQNGMQTQQNRASLAGPSADFEPQSGF
jgi:hypothetical protein